MPTDDQHQRGKQHEEARLDRRADDAAINAFHPAGSSADPPIGWPMPVRLASESSRN